MSVTCDWCGREFQRPPSKLAGKKHFFCSRECLWSFSSKTKNPDSYRSLKDLSSVSAHMRKLNIELNPTRMNNETREKLRKAHIGTGSGKTYTKRFGRHEHRVVAEQILGRKLVAGEVVHHLDFNPRNNDPENIMVFPSQSDHARYHAVLDNFFFKGIIPTDYKVKEVMPGEVHAT